jgi:hypothetical protein
MEEIEHGPLSLRFRQHAGGADGLGNFHLFLAQSLQIIPIHPDLELASHHKRNLVGNYIKSIEINFVNSLRGAAGIFRAERQYFRTRVASSRPPGTPADIELAWTPSLWFKLLSGRPCAKKRSITVPSRPPLPPIHARNRYDFTCHLPQMMPGGAA